jgi:hypothetical protein
MSGFKLSQQPSGLGESGNPAGWESLLFDFSTSRLFHSPSGRRRDHRFARRCVAALPMRPVADTQGAIQVLVHGNIAAGQRAARALVGRSR